jgi:hypothetical protein
MSNQSSSKIVAARLKFTDANANSFANKVLRWELLETQLAPLLDTMPHVKPVHTELVQLLAESKRLEFQVQELKTSASEVAETRRRLVQTGDRLRSRLASALAFEHGSTSVRLKQFGIRPRSAGKGRAKSAPVPEPVPNPQPETPAAPAAGSSATEKK